jgi:hypothetical protein
MVNSEAQSGSNRRSPKTRVPFQGSLSEPADVIEELRKLINHPAINEVSLKPFFEAYPAAIPTRAWQLNHYVHFDFVFPQYPIGDRFQSDFVYLTKSSAEWWCVLVEIESPKARLFQDNAKSIKKHSDLNSALDQIQDWRIYLEKHKADFLDGLAPILRPLKVARNPISFKYTLVIGRSMEFENNPARAERYSSLNKSLDCRVWTYDAVASDLEYTYIESRTRNCLPRPLHDLNLLARSGTRFRFKHYVPSSSQFFMYFSPNELELDPSQLSQAEEAGILTSDWLAGKKLTNSGTQMGGKSVLLDDW